MTWIIARTLILWLLIFSFNSHAFEIYKNTGRNTESWTIVYGENGFWMADVMALDKNGWPNLLSRKMYSSAAEARGQLQNRQAKPPFLDLHLKNKNGLVLWNVTNQWDWNWEIKFADWVKTEIHPGWWRENNIATDCADVLYSARWIFARIHGLPMVNHLTSGHFFTHESVKPEWESLPTASNWREDKRFLAAIDFLLNRTFTHTLWQDSYPVAISSSAIIPGGYHLYIDQETGHTQFIHRVGLTAEDVPLITLNSTVPRTLRDTMEWIFFEKTVDQKSAGLLRMRWPKQTVQGPSLTELKEMPHYSLEQFSYNFVQSPRRWFWQEVFHRLNPSANYNKIAVKMTQQLSEQFKTRLTIVSEGYKVCSATPCRKGTAEYEAWSTPSRDYRIANWVSAYDSLNPVKSPELKKALETPIFVYNRRTYLTTDLMSKWRIGFYTSDPNHHPARRWGLSLF